MQPKSLVVEATVATVPVTQIVDHGVANSGQVHAYLVRAPGVEVQA
jgi:hypothetical protein